MQELLRSHSKMVSMDLSIIIVNWNSREYLRNCISSIFRSKPNLKYEIVVIDCASYDGCKEMLRKDYPEVRFIQSKNNLGFGRANNEAFKASKGRNILFLNPDTEIEEGAVETLYNELERLSNAGIVGAKLRNTDRTLQVSCVQSFPKILNQVLDSEILRNFIPRSTMWGITPLLDNVSTPKEVDIVSGACFMIKRSVFDNVAMFSNDYFMYSEDVDLCFKVHQDGWKVYYIPKASVIHHGGASSSTSSISAFSSTMMLESRWRYFRKTKSPKYGQKYRIAILATGIFRIGLLMISWPLFISFGRIVMLENALTKWMARLRWAIGLETWVKKY